MLGVPSLIKLVDNGWVLYNINSMLTHLSLRMVKKMNKRRIICLGLIAVLLFSFTACNSAEKKEAEENKAKLEAVVDKPLTDAMKVIEKTGYTPTYLADDVDFTDFIDTVKDDYFVDSVDVDTDEKTVEVNIVSKLVKKQGKTEDKLEKKLPVAKAWVAVKNYGKEKYGDDFKVHFRTGLIDQEALDENTWSLAAYCDVNGNEKTCKAEVAISSDTIEVTYFEVN